MQRGRSLNTVVYKPIVRGSGA
uniref:Uncharacterized protein n=1 Tax=Anguilla anguilla TaxID=7936 RepID=A0A0E9XJA1_ANGAN